MTAIQKKALFQTARFFLIAVVATTVIMTAPSWLSREMVENILGVAFIGIVAYMIKTHYDIRLGTLKSEENQKQHDARIAELTENSMNDAIKLIALEAKLGAANFDNGVNYYVGTDETFERFAKLMALKTIKHIQDLKGFNGINEYKDVVNTADWNYAVKSAVEEVKKLWGIDNE